MIKKIKVDNQTGRLEDNQDDVLAHFGLDESDEIKELKDAISNYSRVIKPNFKVMPICQESQDEKKLQVVKITSNYTYDVVVDNYDNRVDFTGLPNELEPFLVNFKDEEKWEDPVEIIRIMIQMQAVFTDNSPDFMDNKQTQSQIGLYISNSNIGHIQETFNLRNNSVMLAQEDQYKLPSMDTFEAELIDLAAV